jgi:hypothetical protein
MFTPLSRTVTEAGQRMRQHHATPPNEAAGFLMRALLNGGTCHRSDDLGADPVS